MGVLSDPGDHAPGSLLTETLQRGPAERGFSGLECPKTKQRVHDAALACAARPDEGNPTLRRDRHREAVQGPGTVRPVAEGGVFQDDVGFRRLRQRVEGIDDRRRQLGDRKHAARGSQVVREPRHGVGHRWHDLEGAERHQWQDGQHVTGKAVGAGRGDRDCQQAEDGNAGERDGESRHRARGPRAAACETGEGLVVGEGAVEVLLVAPERHQVRRSPEELDDVG